MAHEALNISFLKAIEPGQRNLLDELILYSSSLDGNEDDLTLQEIEKSYRDPKYSRLTAATSPGYCLRGMRAYAVARGLSYAAENDVTEATALWLSAEFLTGSYDGRYVGDLIGAYRFAFPERSAAEITRDWTFLVEEAKLDPHFEKVIKKVSIESITGLLKRFGEFGEHGKRAGAVILLDELKGRRVKSIEAADAILHMLEAKWLSVLTTAASETKGKLKDLKAMMDISYVWHRVREEPKPTMQFFKDYPAEASLGAKIARRLHHVGILNEGHVGHLASILKNEGYDVYTRASIAWALGKSSYSDMKARAFAADKLVKFLKGIQTCDWQNQKVTRVVFEAVVALGQLGVPQTESNDVCKVLAYYLTDLAHPYLRLAGAIAFGFLGVAVEPRSGPAQRIKGILYDALGDEEGLVRTAALKSIRRIEKRESN